MPCLLLSHGRLVKTINFKNPSYIGDPINAVKIYNSKEVDELILIDITATKINKINYDLLSDFTSECFMPLAYGGGVKTINDFKKLYSIGIEKVVVNSLIFDNPKVIKEAVLKFGSQSVVASVDIKKNKEGKYEVFTYSNRSHKFSFDDLLDYIISLDFGEIFLTSVDNEGTWNGYDEKLNSYVNNYLKIPIIANGGCGSNNDLKNILYKTGVQAASIGSMAVYQKKDMGVLIRFPKRSQILIHE